MGLALLVTALTVRLLSAAGLGTMQDSVFLQTAGLALQLSTGTLSRTQTEGSGPNLLILRREQIPVPEAPAPETPEVSTERPAFTAAEAANITIGGKCTYSVDKAALLTAENRLTPLSEAPAVLIVHTHTSEAYTQTAGWFYTETDPLRTSDPDQSVVRVGAEIADILEQNGIGVIHDTSMNDYPDYNGAYNRTLQKTQNWLNQYPSIQVVLDIHRDALENADGTPLRSTAVLPDGTTSAKLMLVVGTDQGGLSHPQWQSNLSWALKMQALLERSAPGICRNLDLRTERFNQHLSPQAMLVEVGSTGNTLPEALEAAQVFATALVQLLQQ